MRKNSPLTPFIAHAIKKMAETGINDILRRRHIEPEPNCKPTRAKGNPLGMEKFASLFVLYSISCLVSLIILVMENIYKPSKSEKVSAEYSIIKIEGIQNQMQSFSEDGTQPIHLRCKVKQLMREVEMLKYKKYNII